MEGWHQSVAEEVPSAGELKVREYAERIQNGESAESVLEGLPQIFREGVLARLQDQAYEELPQAEHGSTREKELPVESLDQDAFAEWLVQNVSPEDVGRLDLYTLLTVRPENRLAFIADALAGPNAPLMLYERRVEMLPELRAWATQSEDLLARHPDGAIRGVSGTGWNHFVINEHPDQEKDADRKKAYVCLSGDGVLEKFTTEVMDDILETLEKHGYQGQVKFPMTGGQLFDKFDNIVIHGDTDSESERALGLIEEVLERSGITVAFTQFGSDGVNTEGKKTSHSDLLAGAVTQAISQRKSRT